MKLNRLFLREDCKILKFGCVNINSLANKVVYIRHFIDKYKLSVVAVCETWLVPNVSSSFVAVDGFHVFWGDGSQSVRKHGCCLYVAKYLSFVQVDVGFINVAGLFLSDLDVCFGSLPVSLIFCCSR